MSLWPEWLPGLGSSSAPSDHGKIQKPKPSAKELAALKEQEERMALHREIVRLNDVYEREKIHAMGREEEIQRLKTQIGRSEKSDVEKQKQMDNMINSYNDEIKRMTAEQQDTREYLHALTLERDSLMQNEAEKEQNLQQQTKQSRITESQLNQIIATLRAETKTKDDQKLSKDRKIEELETRLNKLATIHNGMQQVVQTRIVKDEEISRSTIESCYDEFIPMKKEYQHATHKLQALGTERNQMTEHLLEKTKENLRRQDQLDAAKHEVNRMKTSLVTLTDNNQATERDLRDQITNKDSKINAMAIGRNSDQVRIRQMDGVIKQQTADLETMNRHNDAVNTQLTHQKYAFDDQKRGFARERDILQSKIDALFGVDSNLRKMKVERDNMNIRYNAQNDRLIALDKSYRNVSIVAITMGLALGIVTTVLILFLIRRMKRNNKLTISPGMSKSDQTASPRLSFGRNLGGSLSREPPSSDSSWARRSTIYDEFGLIQPWQEWEERKKERNKEDVRESESVDPPEVKQEDGDIVIGILENENSDVEEVKCSTKDESAVREEKPSAPHLKGDSLWPLRQAMYDKFGLVNPWKEREERKKMKNKQDIVGPEVVDPETTEEERTDERFKLPEATAPEEIEFGNGTGGNDESTGEEVRASAPIKEESVSVHENMTLC